MCLHFLLRCVSTFAVGFLLLVRLGQSSNFGSILHGSFAFPLVIIDRTSDAPALSRDTVPVNCACSSKAYLLVCERWNATFPFLDLHSFAKLFQSRRTIAGIEIGHDEED